MECTAACTRLVWNRADDRISVTLQCASWTANSPRKLFSLFNFTGQFDEKVFSGLDFVLAEAGRRSLKLILALTNYWTPFGGMAQYVK